MERWDLLFRDGTPAGRTGVRGEFVPEGLYHVVSETLLRHADGSWLVMRRDPEKLTHPGEWEATAGGSALAGETPLECAVRELREETGMTARTIEEVAVHVRDFNHCIFHSYVATTDDPKDAVVLQRGETVDCRWLDREAFRAFLRSGEGIANQIERYGDYFRAQGLL